MIDITSNCHFDDYKVYLYPIGTKSHLIQFVVPVDIELKPDTTYIVNFPGTFKSSMAETLYKFNEIISGTVAVPLTYSDDLISIEKYQSDNHTGITLKKTGNLVSIGNIGVTTAVGFWFEDTKGNIITRDSTFYISVWWQEVPDTKKSIHNTTPTDKGFVITGYYPYQDIITTYYIQSTRQNINAYREILGKSDLYDVNDPDYSTNTSDGAGGGGSGNPGGDTNEDDGVPSLSAVDCGLLTIFNPTNAQLKQLGSFLWSKDFNLDSFKKLFNDPFDSIFGLSIIPIQPETSGTNNVYFGNIDTGVAMPIVKSQWVPVDMGTLDLSEIYNSALDYEPTTAVSVYLPYIGMRQLNTVDVMASSIHLIYKFDVLTGSVVAQLYVNHAARNNTAGDFSKWTKNQGFLYSFAGQCAVSIPLSSQSFTNIIQSAISGVGIAAGAAASVATGNPALGIAALSVGAANTGIQSSGSVVSRSGHLSGSQSLLDYQTPMLIVIRPHRAKPSKYYSYRGVPSQTTVTLSSCSGYTQIADGVSISAAGATDAELNEITNLLRSGVIF